jgi:enediyne biosynthesis protein E4
MKTLFKLSLYILGISLLASCSGDEKKFQQVSSKHSGITFKNLLTSTEEFNILNYMYFYNGAGVAVADFNGDGLSDIYFVSNQEDNKLYVNKGNFKFEDATERAGVAGFDGWATGVTTADVNGDGRIDLYVGYLGSYLMYEGKNQLFINEGNDETGNPIFKDRAMEYGLDLVGFSTQAAFFDYDRDGDLDMFMLNHSLHEQGTFGRAAKRTTTHPLAGDKLMRNDNGHFVDVSPEAGIYNSVIGYGLGLVVSDVNLDGWLDIYVGNDFHEDDYLYINQKNGTFKESVEQCMRHTSRFTMGVDFADINNDAFPDLISTDMLPDDPQILKASAAEDPYDIYTFKLGYGYKYQFARNNLQINNQNGTFSDIALQAGVASTDWSWASLFADFDLDGYKDLFIANGIPGRPNDLDYINFMERDSIKAKMNLGATESDLKFIDKMPKIKLQNYLFVNNRDSTFTNKSVQWGLDAESYSNSAAYADLDNDGDLDIVVNNIEDEAFLYENTSISKSPSTQHYLKIKLNGKQGNNLGIGTKVLLYDGGKVQSLECIPTRGFMGAVDYPLIFGAADSEIDSVVVIWNDGAFEKLLKVKSDQVIVVNEVKAGGNFNYNRFHTKGLYFTETDFVIPYRHRENSFVEFNRQQLLPHMLTAEGPASAVADVNGDGRDDIFLGGGKWQEASLLTQNPNGHFVRSMQPSISNDSIAEDVDAVFFDADNDKDQDLLVVSGGNEFFGASPNRNPRLYVNSSNGKFEKASQFQDIYLNGSCVSAADVDGDGDTDLFIGARSEPLKYGTKPDSYLFLNDGKANFTNVTASLAPDLLKFGFVKDAVWADIDGDKDNDLIIAAEWSAVSILINNKGKFEHLKDEDIGLENSNGWWSTVEAADIDRDGDLDLIAGNLGLNSKLKASQKEPVKLYVRDFDKNDSVDQVLTHFMKGKEYPFHTRDEMMKQMPSLKKKYLSYKKFSEASLTDLFTSSELKKADQFNATTFQSCIIENLGNLKFRIRNLPSAAQISTISSIVVDDVDKDGNVDLVTAGNFYPINIQLGRYDASYGLILKGDGKGSFTPLPAVSSGFSMEGEIRALRKIRVDGKTIYLGIRNNNSIEALELKH